MGILGHGCVSRAGGDDVEGPREPIPTTTLADAPSRRVTGPSTRGFRPTRRSDPKESQGRQDEAAGNGPLAGSP